MARERSICWCSGRAAGATPVRCGRHSWACASAWSSGTWSAAPACTAAASRPRRSCTPPRSPTRARDGAQFGVHATIDKIDLAAVTAYAEGVVGRLYKGLTGLVTARGIEVIAGSGRLVRYRRRVVRDRGRRDHLHRPVRRARHRLRPADPARARRGRRAHADQRARLAAGPAARVGGGARRWRDRLRVRVGLALVRGRGDDRRGAAPAARRRGAGRLRRSRARVPQARDHPGHRDAAGVGDRGLRRRLG